MKQTRIKAKVALAALAGEETIAQLASGGPSQSDSRLEKGPGGRSPGGHQSEIPGESQGAQINHLYRHSAS